MKQKIIAVHCYAAVDIDKSRQNFLSSVSSKKKFEFEFIDGLGVKVKGKLQTIIVPFSNIACMQMEEAEEVPVIKPISAKKEDINSIASEAAEKKFKISK